MTRQQILDLYFLEARARLIDVAAFLDRVDRAGGKDDFRMPAFRKALKQLQTPRPGRAKRVLTTLSDRSSTPIPRAGGKAAFGAPVPTRKS